MASVPEKEMEGGTESKQAPKSHVQTLVAQLPATERFLSDVRSANPASTVTSFIAEKLYKPYERPQLPKTIKSYYVGPEARGYQPVQMEVPYEAPEPSLYATVRSRTSTSPTRQRPASLEFTRLTHGRVAVDPTSTNRGRSGNQEAGPMSNALGQSMSSMHSMHSARHSPTRSARVARKTSPRASDKARQQLSAKPSASSSTGGGKSARSHSPSTRNTVAGTQPGSSNGSKYVTDVTKIMDRVRQAQRLQQLIQQGASSNALAQQQSRLRNRGGRGKTGNAADQAVPVHCAVKLPANPTHMFTTTSKAAGTQLLSNIMEQEGYTRSDMLKVLDQLSHFDGFEEDLKQALADKFVLYNYPANELLYDKGTDCDELHVVLSGHVMLHASGQRPQRLQPGTVLGADLMLKRLRVPAEVRVDPHFTANIGTLSWKGYEEVITGWAASKVLALAPGLQPSTEQRLRHMVMKHAVYVQREAGEALYSQGDAAEDLVLLVKGQVLLTKPAAEDFIQTEGQLVNQMRLMLGDTDLIYPTEMPRVGARGTVGRGSEGSSVFGGVSRIRGEASSRAASFRHSDMGGGSAGDVAFAAESLARTSHNMDLVAPSSSDSSAAVSRGATPVTGPAAATGATGGTASAVGAADGGAAGTPAVDAAAAAAQPTAEAAAGAAPAEGATLLSAVDGPAGADAAIQPASGSNLPEPAAGAAAPADAQGSNVQLTATAADVPPPASGTGSIAPDAPVSQAGPADPPAPSDTPPALSRGTPLELALSLQLPAPDQTEGASQPEAPAAGAAAASHPGASAAGEAAGDAVQPASGSLPSTPFTFGTASPHEGDALPPTPATPQLTGSLAPDPGMHPSAAALTPRIGTPDGRPSLQQLDPPATPDTIPVATAVFPEVRDPERAGPATDAAKAAPHPSHHPRHHHAPHAHNHGDQQQHQHQQQHPGGAGADAAAGSGPSAQHHHHHAAGAAGRAGLPEANGAHVQPEASGSSVPSAGFPQRMQLSFAGDRARGSGSPSAEASLAALPRRSVPNMDNVPPRPGAQSEAGHAVPQLKGMPLYNALATAIKSNKQQITAAFSHAVFMGEEGLRAPPAPPPPPATAITAAAGGATGAAGAGASATSKAPVRAHTAVAVKTTEVILIPLSVLRSVVAGAVLDGMRKRAVSQQVKAAMARAPATGSQKWPEAADVLREYLLTKPGSRPGWQVEALADAFSPLPLFASIPWQARLRLFQELQLRVIPAGQALQLAKTQISVVEGEGQEAMESEGGAGSPLPEELSQAYASLNGFSPAASPLPDSELMFPHGQGGNGSASHSPAPSASGAAAGAGAAPLHDQVSGSRSGSHSGSEAAPALARASHASSAAGGGSAGGSGSGRAPSPPGAADAEHGDLQQAEGGAQMEHAAQEPGDRDASMARFSRVSMTSTTGGQDGGTPRDPKALPDPRRPSSPGGSYLSYGSRLSDASGLPAPPPRIPAPTAAAPGAPAAAAAAAGFPSAASAALVGPSSPVTGLLASSPSRSSKAGTPVPLPSSLSASKGSTPLPAPSSKGGRNSSLTRSSSRATPEVAALPPLPRLAPPGPKPGTADSHSHHLGAWETSSVAPDPSIVQEGSVFGASELDEHSRPPSRYDGYDMDPRTPQSYTLNQLTLPHAIPTTPHLEAFSPTSTRASTPADSFYPSGLEGEPLPPVPEPLPPSPPEQQQPLKSSGALEVRTINFRLDDHLYVVIGGKVRLEALLVPDDPGRASRTVTRAVAKALGLGRSCFALPRANLMALAAGMGGEGGVAGGGLPWSDPLAPQQLAQLALGATFTSADLMDLASAQPPGYLAPLPLALSPRTGSDLAAPQPPPISGTRQLVVVPAAAGAADQQQQPVELLCMSKPMFELTALGPGRSISEADLLPLLRRCAWAPLLARATTGRPLGGSRGSLTSSSGDAGAWQQRIGSINGAAGAAFAAAAGPWEAGLAELTARIRSKCRVEEYKQGSELLRRGESAPVILQVLEGRCVLRACHVGLADEKVSGAAYAFDLLTLKEGDTVGELSLLGGRPLWYSVVTSTPTARVLTISTAALAEHLGALMEAPPPSATATASAEASSAYGVMEGTLRGGSVGSREGGAGADPAAAAAGVLQWVADSDTKLYASTVQHQVLLLQRGELELELFGPQMKSLLKYIMELGALDASDLRGAARDAQDKSSEDAESAAEGGKSKDHWAPVVLEKTHLVNHLMDSLARANPFGATVNEEIAKERAIALLRDKADTLAGLNLGSHVDALPYGDAAPKAATAAELFTTALLPAPGAAGSTAPLQVAVPVVSSQEAAYLAPARVRLPKQFDRKPVPKVLSGVEIERERRPQEDLLPMSVLSAEQLVTALQVHVHLKPAAAAAAAQALGLPQQAASSASEPAMQTQAAAVAAAQQARVADGTKDGHKASGDGVATWGGSSGAFHLTLPLFPHTSSAMTDGDVAPPRPSVSGIAVSSSLTSSMQRTSAFGGRTFNAPVYRSSAALTMRRRPRKLNRCLTEAMWDDSKDALEELTRRTYDDDEDGEGGHQQQEPEPEAGEADDHQQQHGGDGGGHGVDVNGQQEPGLVRASKSRAAAAAGSSRASSRSSGIVQPASAPAGDDDADADGADANEDDDAGSGVDVHGVDGEGSVSGSGSDSDSVSIALTRPSAGVARESVASHVAPRSNRASQHIIISRPATRDSGAEGDHGAGGEQGVASVSSSPHGIHNRLSVAASLGAQSMHASSASDAAGGTTARSSASTHVPHYIMAAIQQQEQGPNGRKAEAGAAPSVRSHAAASTAAAITDRMCWVRDAVYDPSGITNPLLAGQMTQAVRSVLPAQVDVRVQLSPPVGGIAEPQLKGMDLVGAAGAAAGLHGITGDVPAVAATLGLMHSASSDRPGSAAPSGPAAIAGTGQDKDLAGGGSSKSALPTLPQAARSRNGSNATVASSSSAGGAGARGAAAADGPDQVTVITASQAARASLSPYSSTILSHNRSRRKAATLGRQPRAGSAGADPLQQGPSSSLSDPSVLTLPPLGSPSAAAAAAAAQDAGSQGTLFAPSSLQQPVMVVDGMQLVQQDLAFVTMAVPPRVKTLPEVDFTGLRPPPPPPPPPLPPVHQKKRPTSSEAAIAGGDGKNGTPRKYVPTFLRSTRERIMPEVHKIKVENEQWAVPQYNSSVGFEQGMFDEDTGIIYFD